MTKSDGSSLIRPLRPDDAAAICAIYNHYVLHSTATFEEEAIDVETMALRMEKVAADFPWLVCEHSGKIAAYAYASRWKERSAYRHSAEITVYVAPDFVGQGLGTRLYEALLPALQSQGLHLLLAGISQPNAASVAMHEKFGFRKVGELEEVGFKFQRWINVGYWQRLL